mmetsp:Transcript_42175/g.97655  ORF Transcript_42175/g.97655 Transcript_42175/m.97655 type:complete len:257 (+) Transcript_42175:267-1037(+)
MELMGRSSLMILSESFEGFLKTSPLITRYAVGVFSTNGRGGTAITSHMVFTCPSACTSPPQHTLIFGKSIAALSGLFGPSSIVRFSALTRTFSPPSRTSTSQRPVSSIFVKTLERWPLRSARLLSPPISTEQPGPSSTGASLATAAAGGGTASSSSSCVGSSSSSPGGSGGLKPSSTQAPANMGLSPPRTPSSLALFQALMPPVMRTTRVLSAPSSTKYCATWRHRETCPRFLAPVMQASLTAITVFPLATSSSKC